jgi:hypothetical protein
MYDGRAFRQVRRAAKSNGSVRFCTRFPAPGRGHNVVYRSNFNNSRVDDYSYDNYSE